MKRDDGETNVVKQATGSNGAASANSHTGQDRDVAANPAIFLDDNTSPQSLPLAPVSPARIDGIRRADQLDIGAEDATRTNADRTGVRYPAVGADEHIITNGDIVTVVAVKGSFDHHSLAHTSVWHAHAHASLPVVTGRCRLGVGAYVHNGPKEARTFFGAGSMGRIGGVVEPPYSRNASFAVLHQCGAEWIIIISLQHLFSLGE